MHSIESIHPLFEGHGVSLELKQFYCDVLEEAKPFMEKIEETRMKHQLKVIRAFQQHHLSSSDFYSPTGYGYDDLGREKADAIYASIFHTEDALVRTSIASGTHALTLALQGILLPGDHMLCISGTPYDTMQKIIGIKGSYPHSLREYGIVYEEIDLVKGNFDEAGILNALKDDTKLVYIQRSAGYSSRGSISIEKIASITKRVHEKAPQCIVMVDNCYGEFTEALEPTDVGVDLIAGSLIKNPGGGIAKSGGYIAGHKALIERISYRMTAPGLGRDVGLSNGSVRDILQGIYFAPHVTAEALKNAILFATAFQKLGYFVSPTQDALRSDIVQCIQLENADTVIAFCEAIQRAGSIDAHVTPVPGDMPGYEDQIIMASAGFVEGSSIEISADGPLRPPYWVFYQGGITHDQGMLALAEVLARFESQGRIAYDAERQAFTKV